ncbi:hypothetical protein Tco_1354408 [Tanacetum coccineum]
MTILNKQRDPLTLCKFEQTHRIGKEIVEASVHHIDTYPCIEALWINTSTRSCFLRRAFDHLRVPRYSTHVLFGEEYDSFMERFVRVMDPPEIQLDKEEFHECDSKTCLAWLKKLFETSLYQKPAYYIRVQDFEYISKRFQKYTGYSTQDFKDKIICYLNDIEKGIDARALHEESLG